MIDHSDKLKRELSICQMLANGMTRKEVAHSINRTRMTIDQIVAGMRRRHNAPTEAALLTKLMREGWIK